MPTCNPVLIANHFQNENCHPDGKITVGIARDSAWRWERLDHARALFDAARAVGVHIVHVRLAVPQNYLGIAANTDHIREWMSLGAWKEGTWGTDFMERLGPMGNETVLTHVCNSAFQGTPLDTLLRNMGASELICCGVSTAYTVETTVRHGADLGYNITVAADACSTATREMHENALSAMAPLARIRTTAEIIADLEFAS